MLPIVCATWVGIEDAPVARALQPLDPATSTDPFPTPPGAPLISESTNTKTKKFILVSSDQKKKEEWSLPSLIEDSVAFAAAQQEVLVASGAMASREQQYLRLQTIPYASPYASSELLHS